MGTAKCRADNVHPKQPSFRPAFILWNIGQSNVKGDVLTSDQQGRKQGVADPAVGNLKETCCLRFQHRE